MQIQQDLKIVTMLASGADPDTGEAILLSRNVTNALWRIIEFAVQNAKSQTREPPQNRGRSWSGAEDAQVCSEFERREALGKIAEVHGRTRGAFVSRLQRLGKINVAYGRSTGNRPNLMGTVTPPAW